MAKPVSKEVLEARAKWRREVWYPENKRKQIESNTKSRQKRRHDIYTQVAEIKEAAGCIDCGVKDHRVLDFDHVRGEKKFNISWAVINAKAMKSILPEIEKCDIRCANCHRIATITRKQYNPQNKQWGS